MDRRAFATGAMSWQEGNFELRIAETTTDDWGG
jgi:hypothetical protein